MIGAGLAQLLRHQGDEAVSILWGRPFADQLDSDGIARGGDAGTKARAAQIDGENLTAHPFTPELMTELTKKRCRMTNNTTGGSTASVAPAITRPVFMAPRL